MYELLEKELSNDCAWRGVDIKSALNRTEWNDKLRDNFNEIDKKARYDRCLARRARLSTPKPDNFKSFLDEMYKIQCYNKFAIDDFMDCVCCPIIYCDKEGVSEKLKSMLTNISKESKYSIIKEHKLFNVNLLYNGMAISLKTPGKMTLVDAHLILNNVDKLDICLNCIYAVMSIMMYEITPLTKYRDILLNDKDFMCNQDLRYVNKTIFEKFLKTKNIYYLTILEHIVCNNTAWYKLKN